MMEKYSSNESAKTASQLTKESDAPGSEASLSRREWLVTTSLGLALASVTAVVAVFVGRHEAARKASSSGNHRRLVPFRLIECTGRSISEADLSGKILVVNFVFTSCSLSCRAVNDRMEEIQRRLADAPDVLLVSLTVDPRTDTPAVLEKFARSYHADTNRWLFLTGDKHELYQLIESSFIPKRPELEPYIPGGFTDTALIMLVDQAGNVCASFNGLNSDVTSRVVTEANRIRQRTSRK